MSDKRGKLTSHESRESRGSYDTSVSTAAPASVVASDVEDAPCTSWWNSTFMTVVRWILFLPVGLFILAAAETLILLVVSWVQSWELSTILIAGLILGAGSLFL